MDGTQVEAAPSSLPRQLCVLRTASLVGLLEKFLADLDRFHREIRKGKGQGRMDEEADAAFDD